MNIITMMKDGLSARLFAAITIVSLLLSAFPVAFFVAQAAPGNTDAIGSVSLRVNPDPSSGNEFVNVSFSGTGTLNLEGWTIDETLASVQQVYTFGSVTLNNGDEYQICNGGACDDVFDVSGSIWNNDGDTAVLRDESGDEIVSTTWSTTVGDTEVDGTASVNYAPVGPVENTDTGETFATVQAAIDDTDTDDGDTIVMSADETTATRIDIDKEITLDGAGFMIDAAFTKNGNSDNSAIRISGTDNITVKNIVLDGANGTDLHGINVYLSTGIKVENVSANNFRSGMVVNGSTVDASDFSTQGNIWHGINVDPGSGVTEPSVLNISNTSTHGENSATPPSRHVDGLNTPHIFSDDATADVTVNDIDNQYDMAEVDWRGQRADVYTLKTAPFVKTPQTIVVNGDTSAGENQPGWLFGRDVNNATPIEFNTDESVIGNGALNVLPLSATDGPRKFIGEFFYLDAIADLHSFSYDFKIGAGGTGSDANEFYLNVYANFAGTPVDNFYDCRYDLVPTSGSTGAFGAVTFDTTQSYPVTTRGSSPYPCPNIPAQMDIAGDGATIRALSLNMGDTTTNDAGLDGYFDNVVLETATEITTYDFDPDVTRPEIVVDSPDDGVVVGSDFDITVTATDDVALDNVVVNLKDTDGSNLGSCLNESAGGVTSYTTSCTVDVDSLPEGTYTYKTNTRDEAGNLSQTLTQSFIVDKTGPVIVVDNPADNLMTGVGFDIEVTATDDYGIGKVVINIKDEFGAHLGTCLNEVADGSTTYATSCTVSLTDWADGTYQFKTNALDVAGNISNTITQTFTINTNRPTIVVDSPTAVITTDEDFEVTVTASDDTGIAQVVINIKDEFGAHLGTCLNETVGGATPHTTSCTVDVESLVEGTYNFRTNARDTTGNLSNTINQQFIVDRTPTAMVTMCKTNEQEEALSDWALMLQGKVVGEYEVPADSGVGIDTAPVLAGVSHVVVADGTWENDRSPNPLNIVDAEYSTEDNWVSSIMDGFTGFGTEILELFVGGTGGDWGPYNGSHQYAQSYIPAADGPISLAINDSNYNDNTGSLDVRVYEGFAGITGENGCVVFEEVPYGDYEVAEIMQDGFEPLSGLGPVTVDSEEQTFTVVNERLPEYGDYCGDGMVNQEWEACEADDETGTCNLATCQYDNQCTELNLAKITLDETESVSFNDTVYLGSASNPIPNGVWFNFDEVGDESAGSIANNTQGLGVERNQSTQELYLAFNGGNRGGYVDSAIGTIEFMGTEVNQAGVDRIPNPQFKLENGSGGSFDDVFNVTSSTTIDFDLRADSGDDGVSVELNDVDMCTPLPDPTGPEEELYTISGVKWDDENGDGVINDSEQVLNGWTIYLAEEGSEEAPQATTTAGNGEYSFTVPAGTWVVTEEVETDWVQTGQYQNGELVASTSDSFGTCTLVIPDDSLDQANYTCSFGNQENIPQTVSDENGSSPAASSVSGGGTRIERVAQPTPLVLGVTTDEPALCPFITEHMQIGSANSPLEVMKLQAFLNIFKDMFGGTTNPITGTFGPITDANVKAFQETYRDEVLDPWVQAGLTTNTGPTGFVYLTTKWKINDILCPGDIPFPNLMTDNDASLTDIN